tara:strand:+ start:691 stop:1152 length:462 start_codon:yes stop_codon:yes gene_type:complete
MKNLVFIAFLTFFLITTHAFSVEKGVWSFVVNDEFCYIGSAPVKEEGNYNQRGDVYVLVYRINKNPEMIVQLTAGYNFDESKSVDVQIDQVKFKFFGKDDSAWINDKDRDVIFAMKKGNTMIVKGYSSRGTLTTDTYTLTGFTLAHNKLSKDC